MCGGMLEDRDYMRQSGRYLRWSATLVLVIVLVVVWVLQVTVLSHSDFIGYLVLSLPGIKHGFVWQLLTFQFLHANFWHLFCNCWALYMFGVHVESALGRIRYLALYFLSGLIGGLLWVLAALVWPNYFVGGVLGASAGIFGVVAAFAMLFPDETLLLFFIIPIRAKWLLIISIGMAAFGIAFPDQAGGNIAHVAHLGGILTGMAFIRFGGEFSRNFLEPFESRRRKRELMKAVSIKIPQWPRQKSDAPAEVPEEEFISREVDPILDKISQHGIQSLTERERKILEAARNRMAKR